MPSSETALPARPPYDRELVAPLTAITSIVPSTITPDMIDGLRGSAFGPPLQDLLAPRDILHDQRQVPGPAGAPDLIVSIFKRADHVPGGPGVYHIHGGGMIMGDRLTAIELALEWVELLDAVAVSVEYRLAPDAPDPAPAQDCYAGLVSTAAHSDELGFDNSRLVVAGASAGGGLAAGVALAVRAAGGPRLAAQVLVHPMLDDRNQTLSSHQYAGVGVWDRTSNNTGWDALLGPRRHTDQVSIYAAPARAADMSGLPPTLVDVGSAEVFRDEAVAFASQIWACGGICELHVWPGAFHASESMVPQAALSTIARQTRNRTLSRPLGV